MLVERLERHWVRIVLGLGVMVFFLLHVGGFMRLEYFDRAEHLAYDARLLLNLQKGVDDRVVIVDIDERSLIAEGRWPWGRDKIARLITNLFEDYRAGLVGFDVVFAEPDNSSGLSVLDRLAREELSDNEAYKEYRKIERPKGVVVGVFAGAHSGWDGDVDVGRKRLGDGG